MLIKLMVKRTGTKVGQERRAMAHKKSNAITKSANASGKKGSSFSKSMASTNPNRPDPSRNKKGSMYRDRATINRLNMYTKKPDYKKMHEKNNDPTAGRVEPDRKWFGNVRTAD